MKLKYLRLWMRKNCDLGSEVCACLPARLWRSSAGDPQGICFVGQGWGEGGSHPAVGHHWLLLPQIAGLDGFGWVRTICLGIGRVSTGPSSGIERWVLSSQVWEQFRRSCGPGATFPIPGLRLACQAKLTRWMAFSDSEHQMHRQTFANRALVECVRVAKDSRGGAMERKGNGTEEERERGGD